MKKYTLTIDNKKFEVEVNVDQDIADVSVNGKSYKVGIERTGEEARPKPVIQAAAKASPATTQQQQTSSSTSKTTSDQSKVTTIKSPLPGNIVQILVSKGELVKRGDILIILEAMKMENNVLAANDGMVKNVLVQQGRTVMLGDPLIEIEEVKILNY